MTYGLVTMLALYLPWMLFQTLIDPPGNRLLKWHLAGVQEVDGRNFLTALRDSYGALSWHDYLQGKLLNIKADDEVQDLEQIQTGDTISVEYTESLAMRMIKD